MSRLYARALQAMLGAGCLLGACRGGESGAAARSGDAETEPGSEAPDGSAPVYRAPLRDSVRVTVSARIGDRSMESTGWGECQHAPAASIYDRAAVMWRASHQGAPASRLGSVNLTVWQPKEQRSAEASLHVEAYGKPYAVATVKGGQLSGRGSATGYRRGTGGLIAFDGHDDAGTVVKVMVECDRVSGAVAEGG
jgi:hypothetical protein